MVTSARPRARSMVMRGKNVLALSGSLKNFYLKLAVRGVDLLPVNRGRQDCREKFLETRGARTRVFVGEIASPKQDDDQTMPGLSKVKVSIWSMGFRKSGGAVAILRQGGVMWITILQSQLTLGHTGP